MTTPTLKAATTNTFQTMFNIYVAESISVRFAFKFNEDTTVYFYAETVAL